jgi:uncharacterized protein
MRFQRIKKKLFKLTVVYWTQIPPTEGDQPIIDPTDADGLNSTDRREPSVLEIFDNISTDPESPDYFKKRIDGSSNLIRIDGVTKAESRDRRPAEQL